MNRCSPEYLPGLEPRKTWGTRLSLGFGSVPKCFSPAADSLVFLVFAQYSIGLAADYRHRKRAIYVDDLFPC